MSLQAQWDDPTSYEGAYPPDWDDRRTAVYERDGYACQECGRGNLELHAHHINPLSQGGTNHLGNLMTLCVDCHDAVHGHPTGSHTADAAATPAGYDRLAARLDTPAGEKPAKTLGTLDALRFTAGFWQRCRPAQFALLVVVLLVAVDLAAPGRKVSGLVFAGSVYVVIPFMTILIVLATYDYLGTDVARSRTFRQLLGPSVARYVPTGLVLLGTLFTTSLFTLFLFAPGFWIAGRLSLALPSVVLEYGSLRTYFTRSGVTVRDTGAKRPVYGLVATSFAICLTSFGIPLVLPLFAPVSTLMWIPFALPLLAPAYTLLYLEYRPEYFIDYRTGQTF